MLKILSKLFVLVESSPLKLFMLVIITYSVDCNGLIGDSVPCLIELIKSSKALEKLVLVEE